MNIDRTYFYRSSLVIIAVIFFAGCSQPLRTLMALGSEQEAQKSYVAKARAHFKVLLRDARKERLKTGMASTAVISRYGEPTLEKDGTFLYRDPVDFLHSPKVYLAFDADNKLIKTTIEERDGQ